MTENELKNYLKTNFAQENEAVEWKGWTGNFNIDGKPKDDLGSYVSAIANENGGFLVIGVEDKTLEILGISIKKTSPDVCLQVLRKTYPEIKIEIEEQITSDTKKKIWIIKVPKHPVGQFVSFHKPYQRSNSSLIELTESKRQEILSETKPSHDWSAMPCEGATIEDLDEEAVLKIKKLWAEKTDRQDILKFDVKRLLVGLFGTSKILKATLVLLGKQRSIEKYGINTEITFHYRNNPKNIRSDDRRDFRRCFALEYDEIWNKIDARNEIFYFQKGLFLDQIKKFNESVIREALLNCVAHRDYETEYASSQITIEQSPDKIEFKNPGQLPTDTDLAKLIQTPSKPRNKKLAEVFQKLRLIEKSGFGIDLIVQKTISEGKGSPEYTNFDNHYVFLKLNANLQDEAFIKYLYKIAKEENYTFDAMEVLTLQEILLTGNTNQNNIKENLLRLGFVDNSGAGKGSKLILGKKYYELSGDDRTKYTFQKGLDEESCRQIIIKHLQNFSHSKNPVLSPELYKLVKKVSDISERTFHRYLKKMLEEKIIKKRYIGKSKIEYKLWKDKWKDS